eukprot:Pgem_evm1s940
MLIEEKKEENTKKRKTNEEKKRNKYYLQCAKTENDFMKYLNSLNNSDIDIDNEVELLPCNCNNVNNNNNSNNNNGNNNNTSLSVAENDILLTHYLVIAIEKKYIPVAEELKPYFNGYEKLEKNNNINCDFATLAEYIIAKANPELDKLILLAVEKNTLDPNDVISVGEFFDFSLISLCIKHKNFNLFLELETLVDNLKIRDWELQKICYDGDLENIIMLVECFVKSFDNCKETELEVMLTKVAECVKYIALGTGPENDDCNIFSCLEYLKIDAITKNEKIRKRLLEIMLRFYLDCNNNITKLFYLVAVVNLAYSYPSFGINDNILAEENSKTILHWCLSQKRVSLISVAYLIKHGADVNVVNSDKEAALQTFVTQKLMCTSNERPPNMTNEDVKIVAYLVTQGAEENNADFLLERGLDLSFYNSSSDLRLIKIATSAKYFPKSYIKTLTLKQFDKLMMYSDNTDVLKFFIELNVDGMNSILREICESYEEYRFNFMHHLSGRGEYEIIKSFLSEEYFHENLKVLLRQDNEYGRNPLQLACRLCNHNINLINIMKTSFMNLIL